MAVTATPTSMIDCSRFCAVTMISRPARTQALPSPHDRARREARAQEYRRRGACIFILHIGLPLHFVCVFFPRATDAAARSGHTRKCPFHAVSNRGAFMLWRLCVRRVRPFFGRVFELFAATRPSVLLPLRVRELLPGPVRGGLESAVRRSRTVEVHDYHSVPVSVRYC